MHQAEWAKWRSGIIFVISSKHMYHGDATLGSPAECTFANVCKCVTELYMIGLEVNLSMFEIINICCQDDEYTELVTKLASDLPVLMSTEHADIEPLVSTILDQAV